MSTGGRRGGHAPPPLITDDPGPWGVVSHVQRAIGGMMGGASARRRPPTPGLLNTPGKSTTIPMLGLAGAEASVGAAPLRIAAALPDPADRLRFSDDGATLIGESPRAKRTWAIPALVSTSVVAENRIHQAEALPEYTQLGDDLGDALVVAPDGIHGLVIVREGRLPVLAIMRLGSERGLVRWITGVAAAAWSPDGNALAIAGDWGLLLALRP